MNTQINENFVSFEVAKLLKEKGFDCSCEHQYINCSSGYPFLTDIRNDAGCYYKNSEIGQDEYSAPTLQMAMKWLRGLYWLNMYPKYNKWSNKWSIVILSLDDREVIKGNTSIQMDGFISYEEAVNEGIKYCLINLI